MVAEAVTEEAGVHLQRTSPTMAGVFVRGLTGNKVNVFVDGVRYSNGAQRGGVNTFLNLIDQSSIEGIEVVHGPNSAEYGSDALGGTVQFLTQDAVARGERIEGRRRGLRRRHHDVSGRRRQRGAVVGHAERSGSSRGGGGRKVGELKPGGGIDSHAAVTRFLGVPSDLLMADRLPNTGFNQFNGMLKANWTPSSRTQFVSAYTATRQDEAHRYDQELGGDGNLISELNDLTLDLFYARLERSGLGWFDHGAFTYSINSQREERVNQGGKGSNTAAIGHEPERTTVERRPGRRSTSRCRRAQLPDRRRHAVREADLGRLQRQPGHRRASRRAGRACRATPRSRRAASSRRRRFDAVPDRLRLVGAVRVGQRELRGQRRATRRSSAASRCGRMIRSRPTSVTFRAGAVITPSSRGRSSSARAAASARRT